MKSPLQPHDVLKRAPRVQWASLSGDRLLVRHPGGVTVLRDITREDAETVLAEVDGKRTAEEVCDALAGHYDTRRAVRLLRRLFGEVLRRVPPALDGRVLVLGNGPAGRHLVELLAHQGIRETELVEDVERGEMQPSELHFQLAVVVLEDTPYETLFDVQAAWLRDGIPGLFVTFDADGTRVGPTVVPGETACFACSQLAGFGFLQKDEEDPVAALAKLKTLSSDSRGPAAALRAAAAEARRMLSERAEPRLLAHVVRFTSTGRTTYSVVPHPSCPLGCREASAVTKRFAMRAAADVVEVEESRPPSSVEDGLVSSIGILGGGTAGYLTALALRQKLPHLRVTLVESSAVPVIGVGEATTPLMPQFLHADLGLDVHELFRDVEPTLKLGIRFLWGGDTDFNYPFGPVRPLESLVYDGHVRNCSLRSMMMASDRVPVGREEDGGTVSRLDTEVAYHLDNATFVRYLKRKAREAGVDQVDATVADVELSADGEEVTALVTEDGRRLAFDLYVDCSGFRSLLLDEALASPFVSFAESLFTDSAWVASVPQEGVVRPYTLATAMRSGWCWSTPQAGEDHRGYVFCSAFTSPEGAAAEMRATNPDMGEPRLVKFRAGRHAHFWKGNVVALGNAYGFVEPLESTALHMLIRQIGLLLRAFPLRRGDRGLQGLLNRRVGDAWDYLRWFLALHYKFNDRLATPFWRACRDETDVTSHGELLEAFAERGPLSYDLASRRSFDYPDPLWGPEGIDMILLGQRVASGRPRPATGRRAWTRRLDLCESVLQRSLCQNRALELFGEAPWLLERMAAAFRSAGPAFPVTARGPDLP